MFAVLAVRKTGLQARRGRGLQKNAMWGLLLTPGLAGMHFDTFTSAEGGKAERKK